MRIISGLLSSAPSAAKSATNSPCRYVAPTIASFTNAATKSHGGNIAMSIHCTLRSGYGSIHVQITAMPNQMEAHKCRLELDHSEKKAAAWAGP